MRLKRRANFAEQTTRENNENKWFVIRNKKQIQLIPINKWQHGYFLDYFFEGTWFETSTNIAGEDATLYYDYRYEGKSIEEILNSECEVVINKKSNQGKYESYFGGTNLGFSQEKAEEIANSI